jgi:hydrophobe/amphiphile efflux-3 (HAE3) family protein
MTDFIYRYKWHIIVSSLLLGVVSAILIPAIKTDPEIRNYIPASIGSKVATDKIEKEFGVQDMIVILLSDSSIITPGNLQQIKKLDRSISRINGVSNRISPFTVRSIRNEDGSLIIDPLIGRIPGTREETEDLGKEILANRFARNIIFSSDLKTAAISGTINNSVPEMETLQRIDSVINSVPGKLKIDKGGLPYIRQSIMKEVPSDALLLIPVALLIMLFVLKINLGKWRFVMMPFTVIILSTGFSLALIPLLNWKMSIMTLLVPVILIAVANNYGIYLVARYNELKTAQGETSVREIMRKMMKSLKIPILFSGLTTIAGILGLLAHSIIPARQVGILAATGVALALTISLFLIPSLILLDGVRYKSEPVKKKRTPLFSRTLKRLSDMIVNHPRAILRTALIALVIISSGAVLLRINTNQETFFPKNHPVRQASERINSGFGGSQTISVMIKGDIRDPVLMKSIDNLTTSLEHEKGVGSVFSISQVIREMSKAIYSGTESGYDKIPDTREAIAQMFELYYMSGGEDLRQLINTENTSAHILVKLSDPENAIIRHVEGKIDELTRDFPGKVTVGGYAVIMADFARHVIKGQVYSIIFAILSVLILLTIIFRSFRGGLTGTVPLVASIAVLFGSMGWAHIALDAATALLSSIMIGIGVDFTIQYIWCFNLQINKGLSYPEAIRTAMLTIGRSIIINALSVGAGFSALILSGFQSIRFFGYLVIISIGSCLLGALIVVPAILMRFRPRFIGFETDKFKIRKYEKNEANIGSTTAAFSGSSTTA